MEEILSNLSPKKLIDEQLQGSGWLFFNLLGNSIEDKCICSQGGLF